MDDKKKKVGWSIGVGSIVTGLYALDPVKFAEYFSMAMQQEISRLMIAFAVAAWIHSGRVKKEFKGVTEAITGLGDALRSDLGALGNRIGKVEEELNILKKGK